MRFLRGLLITLTVLLGIKPAQAQTVEIEDITCATTTTTGTGTLDLGTSPTGYLPFATTITSGVSVPYHIVTEDGEQLETGLGVYTDAATDTLTRVADWSTDGSGAELTLPAGTHTVCVGPASATFDAGTFTPFFEDARVDDDMTVDDDLLMGDDISFGSGDVVIGYSANDLAFTGVTGDYSFDDTVGVTGSVTASVDVTATAGDVTSGDDVIVGDDITLGDGDGILDENGNEQLIFQTTGSAVDYVEIQNSASGSTSSPVIRAQGDSTDKQLRFEAKGDPSPAFYFDAGAGVLPYFVYEGSNSTHGTNRGPAFATFAEAQPGVDNTNIGGYESWGRTETGGQTLHYSAIFTQIRDAGEGDGQLSFYTAQNNTEYTIEMTMADGLMIGGTVTEASRPGRGNLAFADALGIFDFNANEQLIFQQTASAVNYLEITNAAANGSPSITATGGDTDIDLILQGKGAGAVLMGQPGAAQVSVDGVSVPLVQIIDASTDDYELVSFAFNASGNGAGQAYGLSRNDTAGSHTIVQDGNLLAYLDFYGSNGTAFDLAAIIRVEVDGTPGASDDMPGRFVFMTTPNASSTPVERWIMDNAGTWKPSSDGAVDIGTASLGVRDIFITSDIEFNGTTDTTLTASSAGILSVEGTVLEKAGKRTLWIPAAALTPRTTSGSTAATREINSITLATQNFGESADVGANFHVAFPKSWAAGTVTVQVFWTTTGGAAAETLEFEVRCGSFANDAAINVTGLGTAVASTDTWIADNDVHVMAESSAITCANAADDAVTWFEIIRDVSDDTLSADAELIGLKVFYTTDLANDT